MVSYRSPTKAMSHQLAARAACDAKPPVPSPEDVFAYLMDMGTGKSKVILDEFGEGAVSGGPQDLLVVAPKGSYRNWFADKGTDPNDWSEIRKHVDPAFRDRMIDVPWLGKGRASANERISLMLRCKDKKRPRALFMNIEALSKPGPARELCDEFVDQRGAMVVIDESTTIKGYSSKRTQYMVDLGEKALTKRILSGLWAPNSPMDLFSQCQFLDWRIVGLKNFFVFRRKYAVLRRMDFGGRKVDVIVGYQNLEDLQERVARYSYRVLIDDCIDLPPKTYTTRAVEMTAEQKKMVSEIKLFGHAAIGNTGKFVTTDMVIKQITRLTQINCGYVMDDEERVLHEVPENRTDALVETIQEHNGKAVIWCPWRVPLAKIVKRLSQDFGPEAVAQWHGGNTRTRGDEEIRFLNDPKCRFMVATQGAGMRGNTWTVADLVCYYANNYNLEERDQSERRTYRKGQKKKVRYVDFVAEKSVDEKALSALRRKINISTLLSSEEFREWVI